MKHTVISNDSEKSRVKSRALNLLSFKNLTGLGNSKQNPISRSTLEMTAKHKQKNY